MAKQAKAKKGKKQRPYTKRSGYWYAVTASTTPPKESALDKAFAEYERCMKTVADRRAELMYAEHELHNAKVALTKVVSERGVWRTKEGA